MPFPLSFQTTEMPAVRLEQFQLAKLAQSVGGFGTANTVWPPEQPVVPDAVAMASGSDWTASVK